jgi:chromosome segregation ATPase
VLGAAAASVVLSILLTLAILGGVNRTLDIGKHASVRQVESDLADLRVEVQGIASRMDALSRRMEAIEGLSGRIQTLEDSFTGLQDDVAQAIDAVESMRSLVVGLEERVNELSQTYARFDTFLDGLRQLLETLPDEGQPEPSTQP